MPIVPVPHLRIRRFGFSLCRWKVYAATADSSKKRVLNYVVISNQERKVENFICSPYIRHQRTTTRHRRYLLTYYLHFADIRN